MDRIGIRTFKASPVREEEIPSLSITFDLDIPPFDGLNGLKESGEAYRTAAKEIVGAMQTTLPGGLFDALLVEMMTARVSLFRVPLFPTDEDKNGKG